MALLKKIQFQEFHYQSVQTLLEIVTKRIQLPADYFETNEEPDPDESFDQLRAELTTIFINISSISSIQQNILEYIGSTLNTLSAGYKQFSPQQKEVVLYLFYRVGQSIKDTSEIIKKKGNPISIMVEIVFATPKIFTDHLLISSIALEGIIRYSTYLELHEGDCGGLINFLLSILSVSPIKEISSRDSHFVSKMCEELFKLVEKLKYKQCITKYYTEIIPIINELTKREFRNSKLTKNGIESLFQLLGYILAYNGIDNHHKFSILQENYTLLVNDIKTNTNDRRSSIQFIKYIALLLRSFEFEVAPELKEFAKEVARTTLEILKFHSNVPELREIALQLFHKLVIIMGAEITPMVKEFLSLILQQNSDFNILSGVMRLSGQVAHTWKAKGIEFTREVFDYFYSATV